MKNINDVFYDISTLTLKEKEVILKEAFLRSYGWRVDKLNCFESSAKQQINMSFKDIMKKFSNSSHFTVILRRQGYNELKGEIGFDSRAHDNFDKLSTSYFLCIYISVENFDKIIKRHKLKIFIIK